MNIQGPQALRISLTYLHMSHEQRRLVDFVAGVPGSVSLETMDRHVGGGARGLLVSIGRLRTKLGCAHDFFSKNDSNEYYLPKWVKDALAASRDLVAACNTVTSRSATA
jgi:hypothetical protein